MNTQSTRAYRTNATRNRQKITGHRNNKNTYISMELFIGAHGAADTNEYDIIREQIQFYCLFGILAKRNPGAFSFLLYISLDAWRMTVRTTQCIPCSTRMTCELIEMVCSVQATVNRGILIVFSVSFLCHAISNTFDPSNPSIFFFSFISHRDT